MAKALVIAAIIVGAAIVIALIVYAIGESRNGRVVRRRELRRANEFGIASRRAVHAMHDAALHWHDVDSVLSGEIRKIFSEWQANVEKTER